MKLRKLYEVAKNELIELTTLEDPDFRLEQAEYNEEEEVWEIVVSFLVENVNKPETPFSKFSKEFPFHRMYKKAKIDKNYEIKGFYIYNKE